MIYFVCDWSDDKVCLRNLLSNIFRLAALWNWNPGSSWCKPSSHYYNPGHVPCCNRSDGDRFASYQKGTRLFFPPSLRLGTLHWIGETQDVHTVMQGFEKAAGGDQFNTRTKGNSIPHTEFIYSFLVFQRKTFHQPSSPGILTANFPTSPSSKEVRRVKRTGGVTSSLQRKRISKTNLSVSCVVTQTLHV